jgi:HD-GYP domain-containing protein (c-di-GMP phosphodiesterase class II)
MQAVQEVTPTQVLKSPPTADSVLALLQILKAKDQATRSHVGRVSNLLSNWTQHLNQNGHSLSLEAIQIAGLLHDIGKIGVLDEVLGKTSELNEHERHHIEQHAELGYQLLRDLPHYAEIAQAVRHHHERWDGKGYPLGLVQTQIPVASRLIAIVDAFDAMTSDRPYRSARTVEFALHEIRKGAGIQFCPDFAIEFVEYLSQTTESTTVPI